MEKLNHPESDKYDLPEKIQKYGDPSRNLFLTIVLIVFVGLLIAFSLSKKQDTSISSEYAIYYPQSTLFYMDARLDSKAIENINKYKSHSVKGLPDILGRIYTLENKNYDSGRANTLMQETFSDSFGFGSWNQKDGAPGSLLIMPVKREIKIKKLFEILYGKNGRIAAKNYQGYKITTSKNKKGAFCLVGNKLFLADSYDTLVFIIDNYLVHSSNSLYNRHDVRELLYKLDKNRVGTVIFPDINYLFSKIEGLASLKDFSSSIKKFSNTLNIAAASILINKDILEFNCFIPYNPDNIKDNFLKKAFEKIFIKSELAYTPDALPEQTVSFINIKNFNDYLYFMLELSNLNHTKEYEQAKQLMKMFTSLDLDSDIISLFKDNTVLAAINTGKQRPDFALIIPDRQKTSDIVKTLIKILSTQMPGSELAKTTYRGKELELAYTSKRPEKIVYGKLSPGLYSIGEKGAVEYLIDTTAHKRLNLSNNKLYKNFESYNNSESRVILYFNIDNALKIWNNQPFITKNDLYNKIEGSANAVLLNAYSDNRTIKANMQLYLK